MRSDGEVEQQQEDGSWVIVKMSESAKKAFR
jgi:hypothetical protein